MPVLRHSSDVPLLVGTVSGVFAPALYNGTALTTRSQQHYDATNMAALSQRAWLEGDVAAHSVRNESEAAAAAPHSNGHSKSFDGNLDAFFYIIVVLSFYALSIVLLMIKYIRREQEETSLDYYYTEYVKRTWFQRPDVQNRMAMARQGQWLATLMQCPEQTPPCGRSDSGGKSSLKELKETSL